MTHRRTMAEEIVDIVSRAPANRRGEWRDVFIGDVMVDHRGWFWRELHGGRQPYTEKTPIVQTIERLIADGQLVRTSTGLGVRLPGYLELTRPRRRR